MNNQSTINVAFCENGSGYGGAVVSLSAFLKKLSYPFKPFIYTGLGTQDYQALSKLGIWRHIPSKTSFDLTRLRKNLPKIASLADNIFNLAPYALRYYRAFKIDKIGVAYLNNDPSCNLPAALAAKFAGIPIILHARGFSAATRGNRWVLSIVDHCIAVSYAVKAQLIELGLPEEKCTVVPEGLDLQSFYPRKPSETLRNELGLSGTERVITLVGGLIGWKGQDILLQACPKILQQYPDMRVLLVGAACGKDDQFARVIEKMAVAPGLQGSVRLLGSRKDIPEILSISTIVLHTSTSPEPFGRTFLEGMAIGKPVIASNEGGPREVIEHEIDGLLIEPRNPSILADAICRLFQDQNLAETLGKNAAVKAVRYSIEHHTEAITEILHNISNQGRAHVQQLSQMQ